jgi:hypothetical protein
MSRRLNPFDVKFAVFNLVDNYGELSFKAHNDQQALWYRQTGTALGQLHTADDAIYLAVIGYVNKNAIWESI